MSEKILIIDDEQDIADLLEVYLKNENYIVHKFYCATDAMSCIESGDIDLAILDIMLPDMNGFSLCQLIRKKYTYPIIMLTAKIDETDKITGLTLGADDYVTKPFRPLEVVARVKAQLRRYKKYSPGNYGVFESKGYSTYSSNAMERGYIQAKSIDKINGKLPKNSLVVMTVTGKRIEITEKDPEGGTTQIKVNLSFLQMYHYLPIVELIMELCPEEQENWTFGSLVYEEEKYSIGIPTVLYEELLPIAEGKEENLLDEFLEKISSKETYLLDIVPDEARQHILHVK